MHAYILETGATPDQTVAVYWHNGIDGVVMDNTSAAGQKYILDALGVKYVYERAENDLEAFYVLRHLWRLWDKRKWGSDERALREV